VPLTWHPAKIFFIFFKFLCRVPRTWHPAKNLPEKGSAFKKLLCRVPPNLAPGKDFLIFLKNFFAGCPLTWHPAKASLPGVHAGTRQIIYLFFVFLTLFFLWGLDTVNKFLFQNLGQF
jgi:hypothetical protein